MENKSSKNEFDAHNYWESRFKNEYSLHGVGYLGLGQSFNNWRYKVKRSTFLSTVKSLNLDVKSSKVLDVGCGTGFYIDRWEELGASDITGVDLTDTAVNQLSLKYPNHEFKCLDIGKTTGELASGNYDMVSSIAVMLHIVDDELYESAIRNISRLLKPGGIFIFSDNFTHGPMIPGRHAVQRPLEHSLRVLELAEFDIQFRRPMFYFMNTPVDSNNAVRQWLWKAISRLASRNEFISNITGMMLYPLERFATSVFSESPTTELMVCTRR